LCRLLLLLLLLLPPPPPPPPPPRETLSRGSGGWQGRTSASQDTYTSRDLEAVRHAHALTIPAPSQTGTSSWRRRWPSARPQVWACVSRRRPPRRGGGGGGGSSSGGGGGGGGDISVRPVAALEIEEINVLKHVDYGVGLRKGFTVLRVQDLGGLPAVENMFEAVVAGLREGRVSRAAHVT
jgi:hypothetical protein